MFYICVPKMEHDQYNFLSFWNIFCTFIPLTTWKIQTFENIKTSHGYIIILHMCTIRYGVWQWYFLKFWTVFCPFTYTHTPLHSCPTPNNTEKKLWKNEKTPWDIIILHMCTINDNHMMYGSWDMKCNRQKFLSFWTIFCP